MGVVLLLLTTGPQHTTQNVSLWQQMVEEWQLMQINESELRWVAKCIPECMCGCICNIKYECNKQKSELC